MTIYKEIDAAGQDRAEIAIALAEGEEVPQDKVTEEIDNGKADVPSVLLEPIAVVKDNVKTHGGRGRVRHRLRTLHRPLRGRVQRSGNLGLR